MKGIVDHYYRLQKVSGAIKERGYRQKKVQVFLEIISMCLNIFIGSWETDCNDYLGVSLCPTESTPLS